MERRWQGAAACSSNGFTTIFHKMEKHGPRPWGTKPTSIPLGEKTRAHRHYPASPRRHGTSELEQASRHTAAAAQTQETIRNNGRSVPQNLAPWNTCCAARYPGTVLVRLNGSPTNLEVKGLSTSSVWRCGENQPTYLPYLPFTSLP